MIALIKRKKPTPPIILGFLYNWYAITDVKNITNTGWSVPTIAQWDTMGMYLDPEWVGGYLGGNDAGGPLKESGTTYWNLPNTDATNTTGFNGRAAGIRVFGFSTGKYGLGFHLPVEYTITNTYAVELWYTNNCLRTLGWVPPKEVGTSLRLIKDSTTLSNGETSTYTGNDGKIYNTICIGTQEWLSENLAETKYNNGDWIAGFDGGTYTPISDVAWEALTTGALCAYDDDLGNV